MTPAFHRISVIIPLVILTIATSVFAQRAIPIRQRAFDRISVKEGPILYGAVASRDAQGNIAIAVRRAWLKSESAKFYAAELKTERSNANSDLTILRDRIIAWRKVRAEKKDLLPFLISEQKRVEQVIAARKNAPLESAPEFMMITLPKDRIRSGFAQPAQQRLIGLYAWKERLKNSESRTAASLLAELRKRRVDLSSPTVDLSDRLPRRPESLDSWMARKAIVEYDTLKRIRFQGTSDYLVEAGGDAIKPPDITKIFNGLLNGQVNKLLAEALGNPKAAIKNKKTESFTKAVKTAEKAGVRGFRTTRVDPDLTSKRVTVEEQFIAKMPSGIWKPVWTFRSTIDTGKPRPEAEKRIRNDPQVKQALQLVKALGLTAGKETVNTAIRFGVATMEAQQKADAAFHTFREQSVKRLDDPLWKTAKSSTQSR